MLIPLLANGCGGHPSSINEKYRQLKNPFCFFLFWKTKSNFAIWFGRPIKGEVKNGRGALLPRARTRRSSGQTHTEQGHTHAYLCLYSTSILIVIIYNLSLSLSLSLSFHLNCLFHCCLSVGARGNVGNFFGAVWPVSYLRFVIFFFSCCCCCCCWKRAIAKH
jgi:hypothetical protein